MKLQRKIALWLLPASVLAGQVFAQPAQPPPPAPDPATTPPAKISSDDAKRQSERLRERVRTDLVHVQYLQQKARKDKDIIKLSCVNDRFINLKAEANVFDDSHRELLSGLDSAERPALYGRVFNSANSIHSLREEADGCVGVEQKSVDQGADSTSPTITDDPTQSLPFDIFVETPGYASPFI